MLNTVVLFAAELRSWTLVMYGTATDPRGGNGKILQGIQGMQSREGQGGAQSSVMFGRAARGGAGARAATLLLLLVSVSFPLLCSWS